MSYSSLYAHACLMYNCCQNGGMHLLGNLYEFPTLSKAPQHSHLCYATLPKLHQTFM